MNTEHQLVTEVYEAKNNSQKADDLIKAYIPFIISEAGKSMSRPCTEQDDEYSIAMMAFYEAVMGYEKKRGAFLSYASMLIKSRLIDYARREARHKGNISLYEETGIEGGTTLADTLADEKDYFEETATRDATRQEIEELALTMREYGICFADVADNCPKQDRTLESCGRAIRYAAENKELLSEMIKTKKLPMTELVKGSGSDRKTLERHRKYLLAMLLIQTNGFHIIRGHLRSILRKKEGATL